MIHKKNKSVHESNASCSNKAGKRKEKIFREEK